MASGYTQYVVRCAACHTPVARLGKRWDAHVHICGFCMRIARHDQDAIARFKWQERATDADVEHVRRRVRSAVYAAWTRRRRLAQVAG